MATENPFKDELIRTAREILAPGKGILAADESTGTIGKRFAAIDVENIERNRRAYRELLFTTEGIEKNISGVIMFEETVDQKTNDGVNFVELLRSKGVHCGIKLDKGVVVIPGTTGETATQGLTGLADRCKEFYEKGCRFAKWRNVLRIGDGMPSELSVRDCAHTLARYGAICQANGLVPIIEPEILTDGAHGIEVCAKISERVFSAVMKAMIDHHLIIEGTLLKPNMITEGSQHPQKSTPQDVAWMTVRTLSRSIVPALPGVVFLSGGQSEEAASQNLNAMNQIIDIQRPWVLTFSYGRALQQSVLKAWKGEEKNIPAAQAALLERGAANGDAQMGKYKGGSGDTGSTYVANYAY